MNMLYIKPFIIWICLFLSVTLLSGQTSENNLFRTSNGFISLTSDAPLELISARSNELRGIIDPVKYTFAFQVDIKTLKGFNSALQQEHFYENYMETDKYSNASFSGKIIEKIDFNTNGNYKIRAKGILDIHGVKQERIIKCEITVEDNLIKASSAFEITLADHDISIPKLVYQKIAEVILVELSIELINMDAK